MQKIAPPNEEARFLRSIVFINCGGTIDLTQNPIYQHRKDVKMYVIDSHRPFNHKNVNDQANRIFIVTDQDPSLDACPTAKDEEELEALGDVQSDSEDDDYDSELEAEEEEAKRELADLRDEDFDEDDDEFVARKKKRVLDDEVDLEEDDVERKSAAEKKELDDEIDDLYQENEAEGSGSQPRIGEKRPPQTELRDQRKLKR